MLFLKVLLRTVASGSGAPGKLQKIDFQLSVNSFQFSQNFAKITMEIVISGVVAKEAV